MSISMDRFASEGLFTSYDPFAHVPQRISVFSLECRQCGYQTPDPVSAPRVCPKCHGQAWERFARPGSVLENAERY
jgi:hypothetical protein